MNFIAATVELRSFIADPINAYGLDYCGADAVVPTGNGPTEVQLRILCWNNEGPKLSSFKNWKPGTRALITGTINFSDDASKPLDVVITTIEPNIPADMYCNQVVLGNAFFGSNDVKETRNGSFSTRIGTTLDNSDVSTWLMLETHPSREKKLRERIRAGRGLCVQGYLREWRKEDSESPYRAIVTNNFTTRKEKKQVNSAPKTSGTATGYTEVDPSPDY